ncbi:MAG: DUF3078 domain-containing protein, partial [Oligoflexales bacterium]|nr:DUF3078 domain-containing protein [Oligoflexales bacterium]
MKCAVKNLVLVSFSVAFLASYTAYSQEILLKKDDVAKSEAESKEGWTQFANLSLGLSSGSQKDVVGSTDGFSSTQTAKLEAQNNFLDGSSDWRNSLTLNLGQSKTPALPKFVKSTDILSIESLYMWHVPSFPEIGPYAKLTVETQALDSYDV